MQMVRDRNVLYLGIKGIVMVSMVRWMRASRITTKLNNWEIL